MKEIGNPLMGEGGVDEIRQPRMAVLKKTLPVMAKYNKNEQTFIQYL